MGYLGNTPGESFISFAKQVFTIVNSQTAYTLNFAVVDENELRLVINNVVQEPGTGKAYTASGTTLTLASALTNGTDEMYCVFLGKARETVTVPTITKDKLNLISNATAGIEIKGDGGSNDGYLQLNCSQNSHGVKIKSPPHSAGQSYTLTLPQSITNNTFLKTDGSGNLSFASAGGDNAPFFLANLSSNQSVTSNANTKINFNNEIADPNGVYDHTTNYRFTPASAGYYMVNINLLYTPVGQDLHGAVVKLYFNGSYEALGGGVFENYDINAGSDQSLRINQLVYFDANDYAEVYAKFNFHPATSACTVFSGTSNNESIGSTFSAYKIIE